MECNSLIAGGSHDRDRHVDDRFRGDVVYGGGADMLDTERALADCRCNVPPVQAKRVAVNPPGRTRRRWRVPRP